MEVAFITASILLILYALLGVYDGFYLHIFKYRLYEHPESKTEHLTHTIRVVLFPAILYFLYLREDPLSFYIGLILVGADIFTLGADAFLEKDSRQFMGGLPRWEYIIHLFVNGFHFASLAVFMVIKVTTVDQQVVIRTDFSAVQYYTEFIFIVTNLLPGAIFMAGLHIMVVFKTTAKYWDNVRAKITCC